MRRYPNPSDVEGETPPMGLPQTEIVSVAHACETTPATANAKFTTNKYAFGRVSERSKKLERHSGWLGRGEPRTLRALV